MDDSSQDDSGTVGFEANGSRRLSRALEGAGRQGGPKKGG